MGPPLQCHTEQFHCPQIICAHLSTPPPSPKPLAIPDPFTVSTVLPFPECHAVGITQYVDFSDWLLLLSSMHLHFLYVS